MADCRGGRIFAASMRVPCRWAPSCSAGLYDAASAGPPIGMGGTALELQDRMAGRADRHWRPVEDLRGLNFPCGRRPNGGDSPNWPVLVRQDPGWADRAGGARGRPAQDLRQIVAMRSPNTNLRPVQSCEGGNGPILRRGPWHADSGRYHSNRCARILRIASNGATTHRPQGTRDSLSHWGERRYLSFRFSLAFLSGIDGDGFKAAGRTPPRWSATE